MPITGTFLADFAQFQTAVDQAVVKLQGFETGAAKVETSLTRMVDTFSGRKIISDATLMADAVQKVGGAANLTEKELRRVATTTNEAVDKLRRMGQEIPPQLNDIATAARNAVAELDKMKKPAADAGAGTQTWAGAIGDVTTALQGLMALKAVQWAKDFLASIMADADALVKLSDKTGITTDALQTLTAIGAESGNTIDELTGAVTQMQKRMATGDAGFTRAMADLQIPLSQLRALEPDQQFIKIGEAIARIEDPAQRTALAIAAFGKSGAEVLPSLRAEIEKIAEQAPRMSEASVRAWDAIGDAIDRTWRKWKAAAGDLLIATLPGLGPGSQPGALPTLPPGQRGFAAPLPTVDAFAVNDALKEQQDLQRKQNQILVDRIPLLEQIRKLEQTEIGERRAGLMGLDALEQKLSQDSMKRLEAQADAWKKLRQAALDESKAAEDVMRERMLGPGQKDVGLEGALARDAAQARAFDVYNNNGVDPGPMLAKAASDLDILVGNLKGDRAVGGPSPPVEVNVSGVLDPRTVNEIAAAVGKVLMSGSGRQFPNR